MATDPILTVCEPAPLRENRKLPNNRIAASTMDAVTAIFAVLARLKPFSYRVLRQAAIQPMRNPMPQMPVMEAS